MLEGWIVNNKTLGNTNAQGIRLASSTTSAHKSKDVIGPQCTGSLEWSCYSFTVRRDREIFVERDIVDKDGGRYDCGFPGNNVFQAKQSFRRVCVHLWWRFLDRNHPHARRTRLPLSKSI
jgi:hypothetical protein